MRVLCLHGRGTSAAIFRSQTASVRESLDQIDKSFTFEFVDGPFACPPAAGMDYLYGTPTYSWWPTESAANIRMAHVWLEKYLAAHGPFDALMGFSQGGSLISSYLMNWTRTQGLKPPPVRAAIFICSGLSMRWLDEMGLNVTLEAREIDYKSMIGLGKKTDLFNELIANPQMIQRGMGLWDDISGLSHVPGAPLPDETNVFGLDFTTFPTDAFITIPTVHVVGAKDPRYPTGLQIAHICTKREIYDHGGGHDIPRTSAVSSRIAGMLSKLAKDSQETTA